MTRRTLTRHAGLTRASAAVAVVAGVLLLSGCGGGDLKASSDGVVRVVASTDVYGDIARTVGGDDIEVTSILTNPDQDPHSFEANPRTALSIAKADLLIENGGGYDDYMGRLRASTHSSAPVIDVVALSGKQPDADGQLNEHVWYDVPTVQRLATTLAERLGAIDPGHADAYTQRAAALDRSLATLVTREALLRGRDQGKAIGITEPVPLYLTAACGLVDKTPAKFSEAIEEGDDVAASVLQETLDLYRDHEVSALVYNQQTSGPITSQVQAAARAAGVAVVPVTETLPAGKTYLTWMAGNLDAIAAAVG